MGGCCGSMKVTDGKLNGALTPTTAPHTNGKCASENSGNGPSDMAGEPEVAAAKTVNLNSVPHLEDAVVDLSIVQPSITVTSYEEDLKPKPNGEIPKEIPAQEVPELSKIEKIDDVSAIPSIISESTKTNDEAEDIIEHQTGIVEETMTISNVSKVCSEPPENQDKDTPPVVIEPLTEALIIGTKEPKEPKEPKISVGERIDQLLNEGKMDEILDSFAMSDEEVKLRRKSNEITSDLMNSEAIVSEISNEIKTESKDSQEITPEIVNEIISENIDSKEIIPEISETSAGESSNVEAKSEDNNSENVSSLNCTNDGSTINYNYESSDQLPSEVSSDNVADPIEPEQLIESCPVGQQEEIVCEPNTQLANSNTVEEVITASEIPPCSDEVVHVYEQPPFVDISSFPPPLPEDCLPDEHIPDHLPVLEEHLPDDTLPVADEHIPDHLPALGENLPDDCLPVADEHIPDHLPALEQHLPDNSLPVADEVNTSYDEYEKHSSREVPIEAIPAKTSHSNSAIGASESEAFLVGGKSEETTRKNVENGVEGDNEHRAMNGAEEHFGGHESKTKANGHVLDNHINGTVIMTNGSS